MEIKDLNDAFDKVYEWANVRGLIDADNVPKQFMKCQEELGEGCSAYIKNKNTQLEDFLGDYFVCGIVLCHQLGKNPLDMLKIAIKEIWDREGQMINGSFVKSEDLY